MLVLNLPFKALMFLTLMRPSLVLFLLLWLKLVKDFLRSEERFSRNAETDLVCRLLLEKKKERTNKGTPSKWRMKLSTIRLACAPVVPPNISRQTGEQACVDMCAHGQEEIA